MRAVLVLVVALFGLAASTSYEGYKVFKIHPKTETEVKLIASFKHNRNFDFWSQHSTVGKPTSVMVSPSEQNKFVNYLKIQNISFDVQIENVQRAIHAEKAHHLLKPKLEKGRIAFDQYLRHDEINAYLDQLAVDYSDIVTVENIGQSYEGRDMNLIHISTGGTGKPVIFIDAGIHAREWIAPAVALYIINQLVENETNRNLIENVDWTILPSANPDGYEYSWNEDRMWRKTRTPGKICDGVDPNRNFDFHWMESGASDYECDEDYAGPAPFSEAECVVLSNYLLGAENVKLYLTLHSYGQYLLYPWGYDYILPPNWQELDDLGHAVNDAIAAVRGTEYEVGSSTATLYPAAGASDDWSMGRAGVNLVYTMELPGGGYGFDMPPEEILGVVEETWQGILVFHDYVANNTKK